jgi:hypothetical protein
MHQGRSSGGGSPGSTSGPGPVASRICAVATPRPPPRNERPREPPASDEPPRLLHLEAADSAESA